MAKEKILIAVKTYPVLSKSYIELACTAGFREDGSWIRLYPIRFRLLETDKQFKKYQWVEADIIKSRSDGRPESYKVINPEGMTLLHEVGTGKARDWAERRSFIFGKNKIYTNKKEIIALAHANELSLVIFKPKGITDFVVEKAEAQEWSPEKVKEIQENLKQKDLFSEQNLEDFQLVRKLPYKFSYTFIDDEGAKSTLMIEDWEIGALYWHYADKEGPEVAIEKVREKYFDEFVKTKDLYLYLGTVHEFHNKKSPNPYVIVGTFHPPFQEQATLL